MSDILGFSVHNILYYLSKRFGFVRCAWFRKSHRQSLCIDGRMAGLVSLERSTDILTATLAQGTIVACHCMANSQI